MKKVLCRLLLVAWVLEGYAVAEQVDPRFPAERIEPPSEEWTRWPRARIRQLETEQDQLLKKISVLPQHAPIFPTDRLGYHSLFEEPDAAGAFPEHRIDFKFRNDQRLDSIALAPAFNPNEPGAYAFPKRFKIEVMNRGTDQFELVVDWMHKDFPDPGPYPVFFSEINRVMKQVRITVLPSVQESGMAYYALGEVYLFRHKNGRIAANMAIWGRPAVEIEVSDSFSMPPLWDAPYLYDDFTGLGFPLGGETSESEDLMITYDDETESSDLVQFTLDLGRVTGVGRIDFWPAAAPYLLALPSFGFPAKVTVEMSENPDFKPSMILKADHAGGRMHRDNLLTLLGKGYAAQYIRITMERLGRYKGKRILGLGEISVSEYGEVLSINCKVTAQGIPDEYLDQLPRLVDGYSRKRRILKQGEWMKGLAQRRPLDRRLVVVERELEMARATWHKIQLRSGIWGGIVLFAGLVGWVVIQRQIRKRGINKLKWSITRDLHDEVGSSLGSIALAAKRLEKAPQADVEDGLSELSLLAREAAVSLREVVWVIDQGIIRLPDLIQKLVERAERVLYGMELSVEIPPDCPDTVVPLTFKRHLIMFFREAVYNCAQHAKATQAKITVATKDKQLCIRFSDNGCGFDPTAQRNGWGLDSMQKRAQELGGAMEMTSQPGKGTTVVLTVPLSALQGKTDHLYKTSN